MAAPSIKEALELKPCPFCGGEAWMLNGGPGNWFVQCTQCKCTTNDVQRDHAAALWNTRATLSPPAGERREAIARIFAEALDCSQECNPATCSCRSFADEALLASGLVQDEAGWRDISTAPKDGTDVLVLVEDSKEQFVCYYDGAGWRYATFPGGHMLCVPDYWRPLPAILSARDGGAES